eukprot:72755-Rhodomonas_salina.3
MTRDCRCTTFVLTLVAVQDFAKQKNRKRRSCVFVEPVQLEANWVAPSFEKSNDDADRLKTYISKTALLANLEDSAVKTIIGAFQMKSFPAGTDVIKEGDDGDFFYILDKGAAEVFKKIDGTEKKVFAYDAGGSFGVSRTVLHAVFPGNHWDGWGVTGACSAARGAEVSDGPRSVGLRGQWLLQQRAGMDASVVEQRR